MNLILIHVCAITVYRKLKVPFLGVADGNGVLWAGQCHPGFRGQAPWSTPMA